MIIVLFIIFNVGDFLYSICKYIGEKILKIKKVKNIIDKIKEIKICETYKKLINTLSIISFKGS
ncbi:hypothetical protein ES703_112254 [subsurface metagenome]